MDNQTFPLAAVKIENGFWREKQALVCARTVPHMWLALNDRLEGAPPSGAVRNFRVAAGLEAGEHRGLVSQDSDLFKWMEAAAYAQVIAPCEATRRALDEAITLLEKTQRADGYLNTCYQLKHPDEPWAYLKESCQLYCAGHMIEAGVGHYEATGDSRLLEVAVRLADRIDADFGTEAGKLPGYDGHAEIELALMRLYAVTGESRYLRRASYFIEQRGQKPFFFDGEKRQAISDCLVYELREEDYRHSQSHAPIRQQKRAVGHAVKAMYFYSGACDVARATGDDSLTAALDVLWQSVLRQMYVTGAIGASEHGESFTVDYDLPNALDYGETCASVGLFLFAFRMLLARPDGAYADVMERALYNGVLSGLGLDGTSFFYTNPLECQPAVNRARRDRAHIQTRRQRWFDCPCCPPNVSRLIGSLGKYLYTAREDTLYVHHYADGSLQTADTALTQRTGYPYDGRIELEAGRMPYRKLALRIPGWCETYTLELNGEPVCVQPRGGYAVVERGWRPGDRLTLMLSMPPRRVYADPRVRADEGRAAVCRGPVVYCAEGCDQPEALDGVTLPREAELRVEPRELKGHAFPGIITQAHYPDGAAAPYQSRPAARHTGALRLIPYALWANRGEDDMRVFLTEGE